MLKAQKKLTKRQIKQDKFVTYYFKSQEYLKRNNRIITYGFGAVLLALLVFFIYNSKQKEKEGNAVVELAKARVEYFANDFNAALPILKNLIEMYSGTKSATEGKFLLANVYYNLENYVEAEKYYNLFLNDGRDKILKSSAKAGIAACLEQQKNYEAAAKIYKEAAEKYGASFIAPENLYNSARCYVLAGEYDKANQILSKLLDDYKDLNFKNDLETLLAEIRQ